MYKFISSISPYDKFQYMLLTIAIIILTRRIQPTLYTILAVSISALLIYYWHDKRVQNAQTHIHHLEKQLDSPVFKKTRSMHVDANLVDFLTIHQEYGKYNPPTFRKIVRHIDQFLQLAKEMEQDIPNIGENYEMARELKRSIMNHYQSLIHTIPNIPAVVKKFHDGYSQLEKHLNHHLSNMYVFMVDTYGKRPIDIRTKFIYNNVPQETDTSYEPHFSYLA